MIRLGGAGTSGSLLDICPVNPDLSVSDPDAVAWAEHLSGDPHAFGAIVRHHQDRLWSVAMHLLRDAQGAEDAVQEGLLRALRAADSFRGESAIGTWLTRIVINVCLDDLRRQQNHRTQPWDPEVLAQRECGEEDPRLACIEARHLVREALSLLPTDQRVAIVLVDIEGRSVREVAVMLGCAEGTVKSRCSRGRHALALLMREAMDWPDTSPGLALEPPTVGRSAQ